MEEYRWTEEDFDFLLTKLEIGKVLVSDMDLGLPTIHNMGRDIKHSGFGVFTKETKEYKIAWCGGGALSRTPSGKGFCFLSVDRGTYPYDKDAVKARLHVLRDAAKDGTLSELLKKEKEEEEEAIKKWLEE